MDRVRGQYLAAQQQEAMLREEFDKQKQEANKLNESAIEYMLLKRDVDVQPPALRRASGEAEGGRRHRGVELE